MRSRLASAVVALALGLGTAIALAGDQFNVTPPAGWTQTDPQTTGVVAVWVEPHPTGFRQNLNLVSQPYQGTLASYVNENVGEMQRQGSAIDMGPQSDAVTCSSHPAHFLVWKATMLGHQLIFEQTLSVWFDRAYVLTYTREQGQPAIDDARAALTTLCIRQN